MAPDQPPKRYKPRDWTPEGRQKRSKMQEMQLKIREKIALREAEEEKKELEKAIALSLAIEVPQDDPQGYPFPGYDPSALFRFLDLPQHLRHRILYHAIPKRTIAPRYNQGSVQEGYEATKNLIDVNIAPIVLAIGNKAFYYAATAAFYGNNIFTFDDPTLALWWLKRIGTNLRKVRHLHFNLGDGEVNPSMSVRSERIWQILSTWLLPRHKLSSIHINTKEWDPRPTRGSKPLRDPQIFATRHKVLRTLLKFRGFSNVKVVPGRWVNRFEAGVLEKAMRLEIGETSEVVERYDVRLERQLAWELTGDVR
ncbi:hypothetical protein P7C71_g5056, partial [Lecanoromycetidae sp. Uapishka_2]